ncbi:MAG: KEOPS complex kinase/ATPase Bud32 [Candidatus Hodarchaeota archaeon]
MIQLWTLGAESTISKLSQWNLDLLLKHRPEKPYLLDMIDSNLRRSRTNRECKMLTIARSLGIPTPSVLWIDLVSNTLTMELISGHQLKQLVGAVPLRQLKVLCKEFGKLIALLHRGGIVHGDPTTSNVIVDTNSKLWFVDFGLAEMNATVEMKGVDLHLMRRAFETTHWDYEDIMLEAALKGYKSVKMKDTNVVLSRMKEIRERGRYH